MRIRLTVIATAVLVGWVVVACGDGGGSVFDQSTTAAGGTTAVTTSAAGSASALALRVSGALTEGAGGAAPVPRTGSDGAQEECITSGLAGAIGMERFAELDEIAAGAPDMDAVVAAMTDDEVSALIDVVFACIDVEAMLTDELAGEDFSPEAASCFAGALAQGDTMKGLIRILLRGEDPAADPDVVRLMVEIMTRDCVAPLEAMLVEEFVADGASPASAACVAEEFMRGGLAEVVLGAALGGTDPSADPESTARMQEIILECLTPEELEGLGG